MERATAGDKFARLGEITSQRMSNSLVVGAAAGFADRVFCHAGFPGELGCRQAGGGGELFQSPAEPAGDGVPHGTRLPGAFSSHHCVSQ
jgi:hypothetical protein